VISRLAVGVSAAIALAAAVWPAMAQPVPLPIPNPRNVAMQTPAVDSLPSQPLPLPATTDSIAGPMTQQTVPVVISARLGEHPDKTRFVVELSDPVQVRVFTLSDPNRVVIDMPEVLWRVNANDRPTGKGAVNSYRYGLFRKGNSRFVIDLNRPVRVETPRLYPPQGGFGFRLVFDLYPATTQEFLAHTGWPQADQVAVAPAPAQPAIQPKVGKRVIVVDAGHGGVDPGTHGVNGLQEKELVLSVAKYLREALEASGRYTVQLTRDSDVFIPLRERVNIARAAHGDLFISIHADSNDHHEIRGASIYTLSEDASDREAAKLAERENMSDVIAGVDLAGENSPVASILIDLAQRDTMNRSARFSQVALEKLGGVTLLQHSSPHRSAGFAVLKGPDVPAVLVELGYLTNPDDEAEMQTDAWRKGVAGALAAAVSKHFAAETPASPREAAIP
jgi:N-acetylmuramoyl-L-alanine amidase